MLIYFQANGDNTVELLCESCRKGLGEIVTWSELASLCHFGQPIRCFECDGVYADQIPEILDVETITVDRSYGGLQFNLMDFSKPYGTIIADPRKKAVPCRIKKYL
jgi:hypothetical protein